MGFSQIRLSYWPLGNCDGNSDDNDQDEDYKKDKDTQTQTKTNTKWFQDPMHAIFFEKQDIKYGIYSKNSHPSFPPSISIKTRHQECAVAALGADHGPCPW